MGRSHEVSWAAAAEAAILLLVGLIGWLAHTPLVFSSLGPTVYEQVEMPARRSAGPYSILVGHFVAIGAGLLSIWATGAHTAAHFIPSAPFAPSRLAAIVIATAVTAGVNLSLRAAQPAALSTALLIALGQMQTSKDVLVLVLGVLLVTAFGQPLRLHRLRHSPPGAPP